MASAHRRSLSIIIPSFNDARIMRAIDSVQSFDDADVVSIIVVDGGSKTELVERIRQRLSPDDILISEPDKGIFDALNKGLQAAQTEYIGWIGSDDILSSEIKATEVIRNLERCDLFIANTAHVKGEVVTRITHSWPSRYGLARFGLNNPHFSTFGRSRLLKSEHFPLNLRGADIEYFLHIFRHNPNVRTSSKVATVMEEGGFSNSSYKGILRTNAELYKVYRRHTSAPIAVLALLLKITYKSAFAAYFKIRQEHVSDRLATG